MTKSALPTPLVFTQNKEATHPRIGLGQGTQLTPSKTASPLVFFPARLAWTRAMPVFKRKLSWHLLAKSHRHININISGCAFINTISATAAGGFGLYICWWIFIKREWSKRANPPYMTLFPWKLFSIYSWFCVILRGYFKDATLLVG